MIFMLFCFASGTRARAATPNQVAAATKAAPHTIDIASEIARIPYAAAEVLYVPLGASEIVLSPLPGVGVVSGITHVGKGLAAPLKVGIMVLKLPFRVLNEAADLGRSPNTGTGAQ
jgi:hypothetical protein